MAFIMDTGKILTIKKIEEIDDAAVIFLDFCKHEKKFAFYGEMGSGKTTFIKAICKQLGIKNNMSSPTFSIINEYCNGHPVYHIDFYRLKNLKEAVDIGIEEYLANENYCFMEWPEVIEAILPENIVSVKISVGDDQQRIIEIKQ